MPTVAFRSLVAHAGAPEATFGLTAAEDAGPVGIAEDAAELAVADPPPPLDEDEDEDVEDEEDEGDADPHPATAAAVTTMTRPAAPVSTVLCSVILPLPL